MEVLELEGTAIWSPLVLHTTHRSLSGDSQDRVCSSERAINQPLRPVPLHNCSSSFFPHIYHTSSLLHFTSTAFFLPLFTNESSLVLSLPGTKELTETPHQEIQSPWVSRNRTRYSDMYRYLLSMQMQFEISVLKMLMAAFQGRS